MQFGDFAGNAAAKAWLSAQVDSGRIPQALLIEGARGSGRRTLAMRLARAAVCEAEPRGKRPCGVCPACRKSVHPDITVFGGDGQTVSVDAVRQLRQEVFVKPNEAVSRMLLLLDAETMTSQAQNALLKILEEPPPAVHFVLTCESRTQLLETVRSRCSALSLQPVSWEEASPILRRRLPQAEEGKLRQAHSLFSGAIGQILNGMEDGAFREVLELTPLFALAITAPDELELLRLTGRLEKQKERTAGVLAGLQLVFRDALAVRCGAERMASTAPGEARRLAAVLPEKRLAALEETVQQLQRALHQNMNQTLFLTRFCACLRQAAGV